MQPQGARKLAVLAEARTLQLLQRQDPSLLRGIDGMLIEKTRVEHTGRTHTYVSQVHQGIPVFGGDAIVHWDERGDLDSLTYGFVRGITVETQPLLTTADAVEVAFGQRWDQSEDSSAELMILRLGEDDHLAYRVEADRSMSDEPSMPVVFVDAHTGYELMRYDNLKTYQLSAEDARTFDLKNGTSYNGATIADSADVTAAQAHQHALQTLEYYSARHGRDSFDGAGARVSSYVHYGSSYVNAFWNGSVLSYGDGDGSTSGPLVSLDIVAHEFGHAVTDYTANLIYSGESGALNEATSDILAAAVEAHVDGGINANTWKIGEDVWSPAVAGDALRYMNDPTVDGASRDHYSERYTGSGDNGGVHLNSGIANLFFYLLAQGGDHPDPQHRVATVDGIGISKAAKIWYRALTSYMTSSTSYNAARTATMDACEALGYGSQCDSVAAAWCEVGVGSSCGGGAPVDDASCVQTNACGGRAPAGCYCDTACARFGDCCDDGPC